MEKNPLHFFQNTEDRPLCSVEVRRVQHLLLMASAEDTAGEKGRAWLAQDEEKVDETQTP